MELGARGKERQLPVGGVAEIISVTLPKDIAFPLI